MSASYLNIKQCNPNVVDHDKFKGERPLVVEEENRKNRIFRKGSYHNRKSQSPTRHSLKGLLIFQRSNPHIIGCSRECGKTHSCCNSPISTEFSEQLDYAVPCDHMQNGRSFADNVEISQSETLKDTQLLMINRAKADKESPAKSNEVNVCVETGYENDSSYADPYARDEELLTGDEGQGELCKEKEDRRRKTATFYENGDPIDGSSINLYEKDCDNTVIVTPGESTFMNQMNIDDQYHDDVTKNNLKNVETEENLGPDVLVRRLSSSSLKKNVTFSSDSTTIESEICEAETQV